jgi:TolB-like protein/class 3 adenylate cyclase
MEGRMERRLAAVLAADVVGYSRLMGADEEGTLRSLKEHRHAVVAPSIATHRGRIVSTAGDGLLAEFASVVDAVDCACDIQSRIAERNADVEAGRRLEFRIGVNLGDVIVDGDDIFGDGVNIAARLEAMAQPGGICVSSVVRDQLIEKRDLDFQDLGERTAKNIARPLRVYRLSLGAMGTAPPPPSLPDRPSIAVMPFANMTGDASQDYFADGIVEDIITALSRFKEFFVIARNSTFVYKGRPVDIQQAARELGVRYVLEGSVRRGGNRVRISGQLIDAETRSHLWANRFDGTIDDVFELQDRITENVVAALAPTLHQAEIERARSKPVTNLDAYDYLLRAVPMVVANTAEEAATAIELLSEALRRSPTYARAHAYISMAYAQIYRSAVGAARDEHQAKAIAHARQAVQLAAEDSVALAHAGFVLLVTARDVAAARAALDRAVTLNPNQMTAFAYRALVLAMAAMPEPAIEDATRALRLSPLDPANYQPQMALAISYIWLRQYDEAVAWAHKAIEGAPPRYPMSYAWLIVAEAARGGTAEAQRALERLEEIIPGFEPATLGRLFEIFPDPLRAHSLETLRAAGLVPGGIAGGNGVRPAAASPR